MEEQIRERVNPLNLRLVLTVFLSLMSGVLLLLPFSGGVLQAEEADVRLLGLEEAVGLALEGNLNLQAAGIELANARIDFEKNKASNILTDSRFLKLQGELALEQAEDNYRQTRNQVIIDIVQQYLQLIQAEKNILINEKQSGLEERVLREVRAQVEAGHRGNLELLQQQNKYDNALFSLQKTRDDFAQLLREFKIKLGIEPGEQLELSALEEYQPWEISEEAALEEAGTNSISLKLRDLQIELAGVDLERAEAADTPLLDLKKLRNNLDLARVNRQIAGQELLNSVRKQYYSFLQAVKQYSLSRENLTQAGENYRIVDQQYQAGLKTGNDLLAAELSLLQAELSSQTNLTGCLISQLQLQQLLGREIGGSLNEFVVQEK